MILHLFPVTAFTRGFIEFVAKNFNSDEHFFLVYGESELQDNNDYISNFNVKYYRRIDVICNNMSTMNWMCSFDAIIMHHFLNWKLCEMFAMNEHLLKKLVIYFWGGDIPYTNNKEYNILKKRVVENCKGIITIIPEDFRLAKKLYDIDGIVRTAEYRDDELEEIINNNKLKKHKYGEPYYIQIGHSSFETGRHFEAIDAIERFKNHNVKIFIPLAYGDKQYAKKVIAYAEDIFGEDKVEILTDFMSKGRYHEILSNIDVALFAPLDQQALGNILALLKMGKKVYLANKGFLYEYFTKDKGIDVFEIEKIHDESFDLFVDISQTSINHNLNIMKKYYDNTVKEWNEVFVFAKSK